MDETVECDAPVSKKQACDLKQAFEYIEALSGDGSAACAFRAIKKGSNGSPGLATDVIGSLTAPQVRKRLESLNAQGYGIYMGVQAMEAGKNASVDHCVGLRAFFIDCDSGPPALELVREACRPNFVVRSHRGPHYYWLADPEEDKELFAAVQLGLARHFGSDAAVKDLGRVMRVPGFIHPEAGIRIEIARPTYEPRRSKAWTAAEIAEAYGFVLAKKTKKHAVPAETVDGAVRQDPVAAEAMVDAYVGRGEGDESIDGKGRNDALYELMGKLRDFGFVGGDAEPYFHRANAKNTPPLDDPKEIQGIIEHAAKYNQNDVGCRVLPEPSPGGARGRKLARGDHAEVAQWLLDDIGGHAVSVGGLLWVYDAKEQLWLQLSEHQLRRLVFAYAGARIVKGGKVYPLKVSWHDSSGIIKTAAAMVADDRFFDQQLPGVGFSDCFVTSDKFGIKCVPHNIAHRTTFKIKGEYKREYSCPRWLGFLGELFAGDTDKEQKIDLLQEFLGACLLGIATRYAKCLILIGPGANGKSTFSDIFRQFFDPAVVTCVPPSKWDITKDGPSLAQLSWSKLNATDELPRQKMADESTFKAVVGGDRIEARRLYHDPFVMQPRCGHIFAGNEMPSVKDTTRGFWRRFLLVEFNRSFEADGKTRNLIMEPILKERADVVSWGIEGGHRLINNGRYTETVSGLEAMREWRLENDNLAAFVEEKLEIHKGEATAFTRYTTIDRLYAAYQAWCEQSGRRRLSKNKLSGRLVREFGATKGRNNVARDARDLSVELRAGRDEY